MPDKASDPATLIQWIRYGTNMKAELVPENMECTLENFREGYTSHQPGLPLLSATTPIQDKSSLLVSEKLAKNVFNITCLTRFLDHRHEVLANKNQDSLERLGGDHRLVFSFSYPPYLTMADCNTRLSSSRLYPEVRIELIANVMKATRERDMHVMNQIDQLKRHCCLVWSLY
ncbi:uncharacterized protein BCR38DRAFT_119500 [Pseudomassariella vexata]|uniref:Uncharacterized protein n=1 Tax=Pseudomassariella vexata TaxID=1141098 RepID=A0A1Y2D9Y0_9PEZI|nr:uncharacterized protein BCR38DRAFT_119500 [Pseudomassariella vexata]ORY56073.1 hypothetical protein BCR38DRAFT_119500 [Pseudomassariella vexata]